MRLGHSLVSVVACTCLAVTPTSARQRGHHPTPAPAVHGAAPAAAPANTAAHPAPVIVPQKIAANPALVARLQPLVPSGMTLDSAATGFRNQGQFIAALHVSQNLKIPFVTLKAEMNGPHHDSLGQAIHVLQPHANARVAERTAEQEAAADLTATRLATTTGKGDRR